MSRPTVEVADLLRTQGDRFVAENRSWLSYQQLKVLRAIERCRTPALGGHLDQCSGCGHSALSFNSCRNRHCPKCQAQARQRWLACREQELLGLSYFHVVFTLPHELNRLCQRNPALLYNLLFRCVSETLLEVAADPKHLGAQIGFLAILHSWGQNLLLHPHLHCLVPVGGLAPDRSHWVQPRYRFFLPLGVLKRVFRGKFLDGLKRAYRRNKLSLGGATGPLKDPRLSGLFFNRCAENTGSSMSSKRWRVQHRCFAIWAAILIALPSAITDWSPLMGNKSLFAGRIMHAETSSAS
jgi:Transposase zinc-binding domain/Putative transposase